jgi:pimeloyl-ACP methyl ester carboxylesterase
MTRTEEATRITSRDGTEIAFWQSGSGAPLVLVHGTTADHTRWGPVLPYLEPHARVCAMDRRGRGGSGDGPNYALDREHEDVAAVVDAVAEATGLPVDLLGHSYGGVCAFGAALLTDNIRTLILYEGWPAPNPELLSISDPLYRRLDELLAAGRRAEVLEMFFREVVRMPEHELAVYRNLPAWQARVAAAHTITREDRGHAAITFDPARAARIRVPVLLMVGEDSPDALKAGYQTVAAAIPDARVVIMPGQQHIAIDLVPETFAGHVLDFLRGQD